MNYALFLYTIILVIHVDSLHDKHTHSVFAEIYDFMIYELSNNVFQHIFHSLTRNYTESGDIPELSFAN
jgi:hypothetical protein